MTFLPERGSSVRLALAVLAAVMAVSSAGAQEPSKYATPAIDRNLYREGEVRRLSGQFGAWTVSCDEIARIKQRFCSLFGQGHDASGAAAFSIVISTGDDGKPAAMLRMPANAARPRGIEISGAANGAKPGLKARTMRLRIVDCDQAGCFTLWPLAPDQIAALNEGRALRAVVELGKGPDLALDKAKKARASGEAIVAKIDGAGFSAAIAATINQKWTEAPGAEAAQPSR